MYARIGVLSTVHVSQGSCWYFLVILVRYKKKYFKLIAVDEKPNVLIAHYRYSFWEKLMKYQVREKKVVDD